MSSLGVYSACSWMAVGTARLPQVEMGNEWIRYAAVERVDHGLEFSLEESECGWHVHALGTILQVRTSPTHLAVGVVLVSDSGSFCGAEVA